jgi:hypothetical protein
MRKPQMAGRRPSERIIVRADRSTEAPNATGPAMRGARPHKKPAAPIGRTASTRQGATMDYQMGFTSGSSH